VQDGKADLKKCLPYKGVGEKQRGIYAGKALFEWKKTPQGSCSRSRKEELRSMVARDRNSGRV